jgi:hypothetical protein
MVEKLFRSGRNLCAIELREREIRIERDGLIIVRDGIRDTQLFREIAARKELLACFF